MADLALLNDRLSRHVLHYYDADAWQANQISTDEERALGVWLVKLGNALQERAARRALVDDGDTVQRRALGPGTETDDGP